jgi:hypothetical protein
VVLKPTVPGVPPRGTVSALNDRRATPIVVSEVANAG